MVTAVKVLLIVFMLLWVWFAFREWKTRISLRMIEAIMHGFIEALARMVLTLVIVAILVFIFKA